MNAEQFRTHVLIPTLARADGLLQTPGRLNSPSAVELILRTIAQESQFRFIAQMGGGPARGLAQMEPKTLKDLENILSTGHPKMYRLLQAFCPPGMTMADALYGVLPFQVIACRLQYWRQPQPLPPAGDADGMWVYYKTYWNTALGAATRADFDLNWATFGPAG